MKCSSCDIFGLSKFIAIDIFLFFTVQRNYRVVFSYTKELCAMPLSILVSKLRKVQQTTLNDFDFAVRLFILSGRIWVVRGRKANKRTARYKNHI